MPHFTKRFIVRLGSRFDFQLLEAVFATMLARVPACDSFSAFLTDLRQISRRAYEVQQDSPVLPPRAFLPDSPLV
jgi:hypothetical protein